MRRWYQQQRWPWLVDDASPVPDGKRPKPGVYVGCGKASCTDCYEDDYRSGERPYGERMRERTERTDDDERQ